MFKLGDKVRLIADNLSLSYLSDYAIKLWSKSPYGVVEEINGDEWCARVFGELHLIEDLCLYETPSILPPDATHWAATDINWQDAFYKYESEHWWVWWNDNWVTTFIDNDRISVLQPIVKWKGETNEQD